MAIGATRRARREANAAVGRDLFGVIRCECADESCAEVLPVEPARYAAVRARWKEGSQYIVVRGHERADSERIVGQADRYVVVEVVETPAA